MGTFDRWSSFFFGKILGLQAFSLEFVELLRTEYRQTIVDLHGGGGTFGGVGVSLTYASSTLTIDALYSGVNGEGRRMTYGPDGGGQPWDLGFEDAPFQDTAATTYHVGAPYVAVPSRAEVGIDGAVEWGAWYDGIGMSYTPDSVTDLGGGAGLRFELVSALNNASKWASNGQTRPCVAYLVDPVTSSAEAVAVGTLVRTTGPHYRMSVAHYFGQAAASASTTAADYRVIVLGPAFATTSWSADPTAVELGTVNTGVWDSTGAPVLYVVGDYMVAFEAEHHLVDGTHGDVTADSVTGISGPNGQIFEYSTLMTCEPWDCSPYLDGQWVTMSAPGTVRLDYANDGEGVQPSAGGFGIEIRRALPLLSRSIRDEGVLGSCYQIAGVYLLARCTVDGDVTLALKSRARGDAGGAVTTEGTVTATQSGAWDQNLFSPNLDIVGSKVYWLEMSLQGVAPTDAQVSDVWILFKKRGVE